MTRLRIVLLSALLSGAVCPKVWANDEATPATLRATLERDFLQPLARREERSSHFSRAEQPPVTRQLSMVDSVSHRDASGELYFGFTIDSRGAGGQHLEAITGCIYPGSGE